MKAASAAEPARKLVLSWLTCCSLSRYACIASAGEEGMRQLRQAPPATPNHRVRLCRRANPSLRRRLEG